MNRIHAKVKLCCIAFVFLSCKGQKNIVSERYGEERSNMGQTFWGTSCIVESMQVITPCGVNFNGTYLCIQKHFTCVNGMDDCGVDDNMPPSIDVSLYEFSENKKNQDSTQEDSLYSNQIISSVALGTMQLSHQEKRSVESESRYVRGFYLINPDLMPGAGELFYQVIEVDVAQFGLDWELIAERCNIRVYSENFLKQYNEIELPSIRGRTPSPR